MEKFRNLWYHRLRNFLMYVFCVFFLCCRLNQYWWHLHFENSRRPRIFDEKNKQIEYSVCVNSRHKLVISVRIYPRELLNYASCVWISKRIQNTLVQDYTFFCLVVYLKKSAEMT